LFIKIIQYMEKLLYTFLISSFIFLGPIKSLSAQFKDEVMQEYLDNYIVSGDPGMVEKISQEAPDSKYDRFCQIYELLDDDNQKGLALSRKLVRDFPDFAEAYFALGTFLINGAKQYDSALIYLDKAIELKPDLTYAWFNRGIGKINIKNYEGAKSDFNRVLEIDKGNAGAYIMRAVSAYMLQDYNAMLSDIEIALQIDPYVLSDLYYIQVRKTIDKAIELAPENANLYFARGYANYKSGYFRLAIHDFISALNLIPDNSEYYKMLGACKIYLNDIPGAESDLKVAMGINPDDPEIYYFLGLHANDLLEQPEKSYEYLTRAIELDSLNSIYYYQRAWSSYNLFDYEMALSDLEKAFKLDSWNGDFYTLRALTLLNGELETEYNYCEDFRSALKYGTTYKVEKYIRKYCEE
jgi:tetratricopeptide (TPR) repeat protein